jgi:hypothetical protein
MRLGGPQSWPGCLEQKINLLPFNITEVTRLANVDELATSSRPALLNTTVISSGTNQRN